MKKLLALILSLTMVLCLAACGEDGGAKEVDMSKYPTDINEWTAQNFNDYFTDAGVYTNADWVYIQDHATYWAGSGTPVDECGGYQDDTGMIGIAVFTIDPNSLEADAEAFLQSVKDTKTFPTDYGSFPVDHLVGNVIFWYSATADEDVYAAADKAYNDLIAALGVTPEF